MREIKLKVSDEIYNKMDEYIKWLNMESSLNNKDGDYNINEFVYGSIIYKIEELQHFAQLDDTNKKMKNNFKKLANKLKISQAEICRRTGIHKSNLSIIFNNKHQPSAEVFFRI